MKAAGLNALRLGATVVAPAHGSMDTAWPGRCHVGWCGTAKRCLQRKLPQHSPRSRGGGRRDWLRYFTAMIWCFTWWFCLKRFKVKETQRNTQFCQQTGKMKYRSWQLSPALVGRQLPMGSMSWLICTRTGCHSLQADRFGICFKQESHWESLKVNGNILYLSWVCNWLSLANVTFICLILFALWFALIVDVLGKQVVYRKLCCWKDLLSEKFCGEGVPLWAAQPLPVPFPVPLSLPFLPGSDGLPKRADCLRIQNWAMYQTSIAAGHIVYVTNAVVQLLSRAACHFGSVIGCMCYRVPVFLCLLMSSHLTSQRLWPALHQPRQPHTRLGFILGEGKNSCIQDHSSVCYVAFWQLGV